MWNYNSKTYFQVYVIYFPSMLLASNNVHTISFCIINICNILNALNISTSEGKFQCVNVPCRLRIFLLQSYLSYSLGRLTSKDKRKMHK